MNKHVFIIGSIVFGVTMFGIAQAASPEDALESALQTLKDQFSQNEQNYIKRQNAIHASADKIREALCSVGKLKYCKNTIKVQATSYNPEVGQTDDSPCIGANSTNVCDLYNAGKRPVALSRDLKALVPFGGTVQLSSDTPGCNGTFQVEDVTAAYLNKRVDIFSPSRDKNVGLCDAVLVLPQI